MDGRHATRDPTLRGNGAGDALVRAFEAALAPARIAPAPRASGAVAVALFDLEDWRSFMAAAASLVDAAETARAARQRNPRHRDDLVLAYALHRLLLARLLGCPPSRVPLARDAKGCPRLPDDALHTSLSHASGRVALAASFAGPVGIDIEPDLRAAEMDELVAHVAHPDEVGALPHAPAHARGRALLQLWVRKEALLKAAGIGLEVAMPAVRAPLGVSLPLPGDTFPGFSAQLHMLDAGPGWTAAVAGPPGADVTRMA